MGAAKTDLVLMSTFHDVRHGYLFSLILFSFVMEAVPKVALFSRENSDLDI